MPLFGHDLSHKKNLTSMPRILTFDIRSHCGEPSLLYPLKPNPAALLIASAAGEKVQMFLCNSTTTATATVPHPLNTSVSVSVVGKKELQLF